MLDHRAAVRATIARANAGDGTAAGTAITADAPAADPAGDDEAAGWYERMWGAWVGREEDWFGRCAESLAALGDAELRERMSEVPQLALAVEQRWAELARFDRPDRLIFRPGPGSEADADVLRLVGYSPFDPVVLPAALLADLGRLDGRRPTPPAPDAAAATAGPRLDEHQLGRLHDFGVAVAPES